MSDSAAPQHGPPSEPPPPSAAVLLVALGRRVGAQIDARLAEHDLTYRHLSALGHLAHEPDLSYSELGRRVGVTAQSMQATLDQLIARRAVERTTPAGRGRTARLRVTADGAVLLRAATGVVADVERELLVDLGEADRRALVATLLGLLARFLR